MRMLKTAGIGCVLAQVADLVSSLGLKPAYGFIESNPLARNPDGSFNLMHGIIMKSNAFLFMSAISALIYLTLRHWDKTKAEAIATSPYLLLAVTGLFATMHNILLYLMP